MDNGTHLSTHSCTHSLTCLLEQRCRVDDNSLQRATPIALGSRRTLVVEDLPKEVESPDICRGIEGPHRSHVGNNINALEDSSEHDGLAIQSRDGTGARGDGEFRPDVARTGPDALVVG